MIFYIQNLSLPNLHFSLDIKEASGAISGPGAYGKLKFESGVHRVQV
jgi:protein subunit release factor A